MPPRLYVAQPLGRADCLPLPPDAARHAQVLRLQPGDALTLFDGHGGEWSARVRRMGRSEVDVEVLAHDPVDRELPLSVCFALGMPANDRMDALVEKATEMGAAGLQPLMTERSVLRLSGERAERRREHWQGVAVAAAEQSGRTRVPTVGPVLNVRAWLDALPTDDPRSRWLLAFGDTTPLAQAPIAPDGVLVLSGPEGGLSAAEEDLAMRAGFRRVGLGARVLRADTAPLAVLGYCGAAGRPG